MRTRNRPITQLHTSAVNTVSTLYLGTIPDRRSKSDEGRLEFFTASVHDRIVNSVQITAIEVDQI